MADGSVWKIYGILFFELSEIIKRAGASASALFFVAIGIFKLFYKNALQFI